MTTKQAEAAFASLQKTMSKLQSVAASAGVSIEEAAKSMRNYSVAYGSDNVAAGAHSSVIGNKTEPVYAPMLDKQYTSVYSDAEFDFDKNKTKFISMLDEASVLDTVAEIQEYVDKVDYSASQVKGCRILLRNDTSSNWDNATIIPLKGEICIEYSDDGRECHAKCGDGVRPFRELPYITAPFTVTREYQTIHDSCHNPIMTLTNGFSIDFDENFN